MEQMETESEAIERLKTEGYDVQYQLSDLGLIECHGGAGLSSCAPSEVVVDAILRFEGMSDPSDESMLLALVGPTGERGTLLLPYGPEMTADQVDASQSLLISHRDRNIDLNSPGTSEAHEDPRMREVQGDEGMPGEYLDTPNNEPGDHSPPLG